MSQPDYYRILGVEETATAEQIRTAYRSLARKLHPDRVTELSSRRQAEIRMAVVNEAWQVLGDPKRRSNYDRERNPVTQIESPQFSTVTSDPFNDIQVSAATGCALRFGPVVLAVGVLIGLLVVTALASGNGDSPTRLSPGRCVQVEEESLRVVPCTLGVPEIISKGVAGTSCPVGSISVILGTRTEQVCLVPHG